MLMDERWIARDQRANRVEVIAPDRVRELHREWTSLVQLDA
jgi:hypothetical protein